MLTGIGRILIALLLAVGIAACGAPKDYPEPPKPVPIEEPAPVVVPDVPEVVPEEVPILEPENLPEKPEEPIHIESDPWEMPVKFKEGEVVPTPMGCREGIDVDC